MAVSSAKKVKVAGRKVGAIKKGKARQDGAVAPRHAKSGGTGQQEEEKKKKKEKKRRGPSRFIQDVQGGDDDDDDDDNDDADGGQGGRDTQRRLRTALEAQEMAVQVSDDDEPSDRASGSGSDGEGSSTRVAVGGERQKAGPSRPKPGGAGRAQGDLEALKFLEKMDKGAVSLSRAEIARLRKEENKEQRRHERELKKSKADRDQVEGYHSDGGSTDMAGLSQDEAGTLSDMEDWSEDGGADLLGSEDGDDEEPESSMDEEAREEAYANRLTKQQRRRSAERAEELRRLSKRKLPVMRDGSWTEESVGSDEDASDAEGKKAGGRQAKRSRVVHEPLRAESDDEEEADEPKAAQPSSTITSAARFGMQAPYAILSMPKRSQRTLAAREQIAKLSTDIVGDPEVGLGLLRRLAVFAGREIAPPDHASAPGGSEAAKRERQPRPVDDAIRAAAIMSLCAVFVDVLPGYRIRPLTDKEKSERVNQETARRREWEQGLVEVYRSYLELCDDVLREKHVVAPVALRAMCLLLTRATHFNFRTNLVRSVVSHLSRRGWTKDSQLCADSLTEVIRRDAAGEVSLEVVRLLHRMIKERRYKVNAMVLDILLHLRLRDELGSVRGGTTTAVDEDAEREKAARERERRRQLALSAGKGKAKPKDVRKGLGQHLSKKQVKHMREVRDVEEEMKEAEAVVDAEERAKAQTETLKLLFVLYFSILKSESVSGALLASALEGLSRFAHRINVDFFRDLLAVLRQHVVAALGRLESPSSLPEGEGSGGGGKSASSTLSGSPLALREVLLCLVTAFELLSGQGEALNLDLSDMVSHLYAVMLPLCVSPSIEEVPKVGGADGGVVGSVDDRRRASEGATVPQARATTTTHLARSNADLLVRALELCLLRPRASTLPAERCAALAKRCLTCCLQVPARTSVRLLVVVRNAMARNGGVEALLETTDRARDGRYDPEGMDVDAARPLAAGEAAWELHALERHVHADVAAEARRLRTFRR